MTSNIALKQALPKLIEHWVPFNPDLLLSLQKKVGEDSQATQENLSQELKNDPFLYTWLVLQNKLDEKSSGDTESPLASRVFTTLQKLNGKRTALNHHSFSFSTPIQQRAIRKIVTRTTAANTLAQYFNVDADKAFTTATLRELGLALIMWNYPHIYTQALEWINPQETSEQNRNKLLDQRLAKQLGFSPFTLMVAIANQMDLSVDVHLGIGQSTELLNPSSDAARVGATLKKVAEISDVFARATLPNASSSILEEWKNYRSELLPIIGHSGFTALKEACSKTLQQYVKIIPEIVAHPIPQSLYAQEKKTHTQLYLQNLHIPMCNKETQDQLHALYSQVNPRVISFKNIEKLMKQVAPIAGFSRGALYILNADLLQLDVRISFNQNDQIFDNILYRDPRFRDHVVSRTFLGKAPFIENREQNNISSFTGILGEIQRVGVVYLEFSPEPSTKINYRSHFKALQQALGDCLNLY